VRIIGKNERIIGKMKECLKNENMVTYGRNFQIVIFYENNSIFFSDLHDGVYDLNQFVLEKYMSQRSIVCLAKTDIDKNTT